MRVAATLGVAVVLAALTGCNDSALTKRELVVYFNATATDAQQRATLKACSGVAPHTSPEPILVSKYASDRVGAVRFRVDHASDHDLAVLYRCLHDQPGVVGVDIPDLTN